MTLSRAMPCAPVCNRPMAWGKAAMLVRGAVSLLLLCGSNAFCVVKESLPGPLVHLANMQFDNDAVSRMKIKVENDSQENLLGRRECINKFLTVATLPLVVSSSSRLQPALAFEGGVGGLGKTKPNVGVFFLEGSEPIQNSQGVVSAELLLDQNKVVRVKFQSPWPLLSTSSGLEARNLQQPESAFVQVMENASLYEKQIKSIIVNDLLGSQGKYGAYGTPSDIKIKPIRDLDLYSVTFTALTPSLRESERQLLIRVAEIGKKNLILLVTGTTRLRFKSQQETLLQVADSFEAIEAPPLRSK